MVEDMMKQQMYIWFIKKDVLVAKTIQLHKYGEMSRQSKNRLENSAHQFLLVKIKHEISSEWSQRENFCKAPSNTQWVLCPCKLLNVTPLYMRCEGVVQCLRFCTKHWLGKQGKKSMFTQSNISFIYKRVYTSASHFQPNPLSLVDFMPELQSLWLCCKAETPKLLLCSRSQKGPTFCPAQTKMNSD